MVGDKKQKQINAGCYHEMKIFFNKLCVNFLIFSNENKLANSWKLKTEVYGGATKSETTYIMYGL